MELNTDKSQEELIVLISRCQTSGFEAEPVSDGSSDLLPPDGISLTPMTN